MKKLLLAAFALVIGWQGIRYFTRSPFALTNSREKNVAILQRVAAELNRDLPKKLDEETTLLRVDVTNVGVVNRYKLTSLGPLSQFQFLDQGTRDQVSRGLRAQTCANKGYRMAMGKGFSISYSYVDRNDKPVATFTYRHADCLGI